MKKGQLLLCALLAGCSTNEISPSNEDEMNPIQQIQFYNDYLENDYVHFTGRTFYKDGVIFSNSNTYLDIEFYGTKLIVNVEGNAFTYASVFVDGETDSFKATKIRMNRFADDLTLIENLNNQRHHVRLYKVSEAQEGYFKLHSISTDGYFIKSQPEDSLKIEFYGDSLTCGYCVEGIDETTPYRVDNENSTKAFAYYTASLLDASFSSICASGWGVYQGYSGSTGQVIPLYVTKCDMVNHVDWDASLFQSDVIVINLGANDSSAFVRLNDEKQKEDFLNQFKKCYLDFVKQLNQLQPKAKIILTSGMVVMNSQISQIIDEISQMFDYTYRFKYTSLSVGGPMPAYHPNNQMHKKAASELATYIQSVL